LGFYVASWFGVAQTFIVPNVKLAALNFKVKVRPGGFSRVARLSKLCAF
jgi:hypothetical protein